PRRPYSPFAHEMDRCGGRGDRPVDLGGRERPDRYSIAPDAGRGLAARAGGRRHRVEAVHGHPRRRHRCDPRTATRVDTGAAQEQSAEARVRTRQAVTTLQAAQQALANGNGDVAGTLANVAPSLPLAAQMEITAAQQSLEANDLYGARAHIAAAIAASSR